jgi:hypothetical protein
MSATAQSEPQNSSDATTFFAQVKKFLHSVFPSLEDVIDSLRIFGLILIGGIVLFPLTSRLPLLGWDWYYFFNANHPTDNIYSPYSPFFPYTKYIIMTLTWMDWRSSLAFLSGLTFMAIAIGTWKYGGRYGSIALALLTPLPLLALWVGHPEGLVLVGLLTSFIPLALVKPQITFWAFLRSKATIFWLVVFMVTIAVIWPSWYTFTTGIRWNHSSSMGWQALGLPVLLTGLVLIAGAGNDPWLLMSAGAFITPDLMPYHMVVLLPAIGRVKGSKKIIVWFTTWLVALALGLGGYFRYTGLLFPLSIYLSLQSREHYQQVINSYIQFLKTCSAFVSKRLVRPA